MKRKFHRWAAAGAVLAGAALTLLPVGAASAGTVPAGPALLGQHCVAVRLADNDWIRACAAVADDGSTGPFAVPLRSQGVMGVYTHDREGGIVLVPAGTYMIFIENVSLYTNHDLVDTVQNPLDFSFGPSYASLSGDPESVPSGYVEAEMQYELFSTTGQTGTLTVWSDPVPASDL